MATVARSVREACASAKDASRVLAGASTETKNAALRRVADLLGDRVDSILEANAADLADERAAGLTEALRDRLTLSAERIAAMADGVREIVALPDPVGEGIAAFRALFTI